VQLRNPKEVSTEDYNEFYKKTFNEYLEPLASSHFTTEVTTILILDVIMIIFFSAIKIHDWIYASKIG
jgi:HSP90 family molecular chaperone